MDRRAKSTVEAPEPRPIETLAPGSNLAVSLQAFEAVIYGIDGPLGLNLRPVASSGSPCPEECSGGARCAIACDKFEKQAKYQLFSHADGFSMHPACLSTNGLELNAGRSVPRMTGEENSAITPAIFPPGSHRERPAASGLWTISHQTHHRRPRDGDRGHLRRRSRYSVRRPATPPCSSDRLGRSSDGSAAQRSVAGRVYRPGSGPPSLHPASLARPLSILEPRSGEEVRQRHKIYRSTS